MEDFCIQKVEVEQGKERHGKTLRGVIYISVRIQDSKRKIDKGVHGSELL